MTHASVFSGIGGPELAATILGWDNLFHCEINPFGRKVIEYWYPKAKSYEDITTTDFTEWKGRVNVLTGGFPCQPFSYARKRRGAEDDRYLWPYMFRCIDQVQPDWIIAENVASDSNSERLQIWHGERIGQIQQGQRFKTLHSEAGLGRWDTFPTVSPVHRRNDGIPFDVDRLSIPFNKWRTESLKAYGNAIVPQVMY